MTRNTLSALALLLVGACASGPQETYAWQHPSGKSPHSEDGYTCERDARMAYGGGSFGRGLDAIPYIRGFLGRCMESKGYFWAPLPVSPSMTTAGPPTAMSDASGRTYSDQEKVRCRFSPEVETVFPAKVCSQGRGAILGPA
jgi:hypothetical protein